MLNIKQYSHNFAVIEPNPKYVTYIDEFAKTHLLQINYYKTPQMKVVQQVSKMFAVRSKDPLIYRFHINLLEQFKDYLRNHGCNDFNIELVPMYQPYECEFTLVTDKTPWGMQPEIIDYLCADGKKKVIELQTGQGKQEINGTPIRTINGWTNIEDLKVGDKVMGETGEFHNVIGVYPQGDQHQLYKLTFRDGRTSIVGEEHLWQVKYCPKGVGFNTTKGVLSTKEIYDYQNNLKTGLQRFYIPLLENKVPQPDIDLPIDPYLLGVILGDGSIRKGVVTIDKPVEELHSIVRSICEREGYQCQTVFRDRLITLANGEIRKTKIIKTRIYRKVGTGKCLLKTLDELGLMNKFSWDKFIPDIYLLAGTEQRFELVRGLMDTDGTPTPAGGMDFSSASKSISDSLATLLYSLGCMVNKNVKQPKYTYQGVRKLGRPAYRLHVRAKSAIQFFKTEERKSRARESTQYSKDLHLRIEKVEKLDYKAHCTCIAVDNPTRLYITKDYIVTHNTFCALYSAWKMKTRFFLSIKPMYIKRWLDDLAKPEGIFNLKPGELITVQGSKELAGLIHLALTNQLHAKFIVVSNKTLHLYYKEYMEGLPMDKYHNVLPYELFEVLKVGVRLIDEAHQDFHQCYKTDLFSHVPKTIELSATLHPDNPFLKRMYETVYPLKDRLGGGVYKKYVDCYSVPYKIDRDNKSSIRYNQKGRISYSHGTMEETILKDNRRCKNYLKMVSDLTETYFIKKRVSDYKLLIFASRVVTCQLIVDELKKKYPNLKITKYTEEEDYRILPEMDIIVSTPISAGTAVDIPKLQVCINTVAIGNTQANLQMIGRLRELRDTDVKPTFLYLYCVDIPKHVEYHYKKKDHVFKDRVLSYIDLQPAKWYI